MDEYKNKELSLYILSNKSEALLIEICKLGCGIYWSGNTCADAAELSVSTAAVLVHPM